jgi:hypothetical protein
MPKADPVRIGAVKAAPPLASAGAAAVGSVAPAALESEPAAVGSAVEGSVAPVGCAAAGGGAAGAAGGALFLAAACCCTKRTGSRV